MEDIDGTITADELRTMIKDAINIQEVRGNGSSQLILHCVLEYLDSVDEEIIESIDEELEDLEIELGKIIVERMKLKDLKDEIINQNG